MANRVEDPIIWSLEYSIDSWPAAQRCGGLPMSTFCTDVIHRISIKAVPLRPVAT
jgi:hypothetical protein